MYHNAGCDGDLLSSPPSSAYAPVVACHVRDVLNYWLAKKAITPSQHAAGRHFLRLYDATLGGRSTIDPERIRVDGSLGHGPATERILMARSELEAMKAVVGEFDFALLCRILGMGRDLKVDTPEEADRKYLARRVRDALATIANQDRITAPAA